MTFGSRVSFNNSDKMIQYVVTVPFTLLKFLLFCIWGILKKIIPYSLARKKSISDEIVLITGAGSGIGRQTAIYFAEHGATLVLWDIDTAGNTETAKLVRDCGVKAYTYTCDVTKRNDVYRVAQRVKEEVGPVFILVNNAGVVAGQYFLKLKDEEIIKTMEVNTMAHFWTLRAFLPDMVRNDHGHVVTISSILGEIAMGGLSEYCASKFAVRGLHDTLVREMAVLNSQVKCTVVCPFGIMTRMFDGVKFSNDFLVPFMTPEYVSKKIVQAVLTDTDVLYLPPHMHLMVIMRAILPTPALLLLEDIVKLNEGMNTFTGKRGELKKVN